LSNVRSARSGKATAMENGLNIPVCGLIKKQAIAGIILQLPYQLAGIKLINIENRLDYFIFNTIVSLTSL
jgi:hypothetical protein